MSCHIITFFSVKGGVGKTTSCANIGLVLGKMNIKTLIIDMDPIGSLSSNFLLSNINGSKQLLENKITSFQDVVFKNVFNNVDVVPTTIDLSFMFMDNDILKYEENLKENIKKLKEKYDIILIDVASSWSNLNRMVLSITDSLLLPILCTPYAIDTISKILNIIRNIQIERNPNLKIAGVFINMFDKRKKDSMVYLSELAKIFGNNLYDSIIPNDISITKLQKNNKFVVESSAWTPSAIKFSELTKEIYQKLKKHKLE